MRGRPLFASAYIKTLVAATCHVCLIYFILHFLYVLFSSDNISTKLTVFRCLLAENILSDFVYPKNKIFYAALL